jgi:hypothetical protein
MGAAAGLDRVMRRQQVRLAGPSPCARHQASAAGTSASGNGSGIGAAALRCPPAACAASFRSAHPSGGSRTRDRPAPPPTIAGSRRRGSSARGCAGSSPGRALARCGSTSAPASAPAGCRPSRPRPRPCPASANCAVSPFSMPSDSSSVPPSAGMDAASGIRQPPAGPKPAWPCRGRRACARRHRSARSRFRDRLFAFRWPGRSARRAWRCRGSRRRSARRGGCRPPGSARPEVVRGRRVRRRSAGRAAIHAPRLSDPRRALLLTQPLEFGFSLALPRRASASMRVRSRRRLRPGRAALRRCGT